MNLFFVVIIIEEQSKENIVCKIRKALSVKSNAQYYIDAVEAYEHKTLSILGVQWHPERMCFSKERSDTVCGVDIFRHFVNLCKGN